jgi:ubiquinone/menaquinone biosynthesis C-methylase UbiE
MALYDQIGQNYQLTRRADPYICQKLYEYLKPGDKNDNLILDVGCGTGSYTIALALKSLCFYGMDPSGQMLDKAKKKSSEILWRIGFAENIPFTDCLFDGVLATLTIHHWSDLSRGISEIYRVLKPSSRFVIFTSLQEQMKKYWLNHYFPKMMEKSIREMPSRISLVDAAILKGFRLLTEEPYFIADHLQDLFLYSGKNNPQMYLLDEIRNGISSFANLGTEAETRIGLDKLKSDAESNAFNSIKTKFSDEAGDYTFFVFEK